MKYDVKDLAKRFVKGTLKFTSRAVFYLPSKEEGYVVRALKIGALAHSAYESFKPEEPKKEDEDIKVKLDDLDLEKDPSI